MRAGLIAFAGLPLLVDDRLVGVMTMFARRALSEATLDAMASVARELAVGIERIRVEQELQRAEEDRRIARTIQQGLLPRAMPRVPGFQVATRLAMAEQVGGDCFDFLRLPRAGQETLGVLVGDASGHGVGAALLMAETRAYLRALALTCADVGQLLTMTNRRLAGDLTTDHFVTVLLLRLDPGARSVIHASAGHCPGYVLDREGRTRAVLASTGAPLGIDAGGAFATGPAVGLEPRGLVLLFTDGVVEAAAADREQFGVGRTLEVVRAHRRETPDAILDALFQAVSEFSGPRLQDDATAVIIKVDEN